MTWPDIVNGAFECLAALFLLLNLRRLSRDKCTRGISITAVVFFSMWGGWNLYYYPYLDQWVSFVGGIAVVLVNSAWVCLAVWYTYRNKAEGS